MNFFTYLVSSSRSDLSEDASGTSAPFVSLPGPNQEPIEKGRINLIGANRPTVVSSTPTVISEIQQMAEKQQTDLNGPIPTMQESVKYESDYNKNDIREHVDITPRR